MIQIIGLFLVKNEDIYIERVVRNVIDFCDKIYICDHYSTDGTGLILKKLKNEFSKIELHRVSHPKDSHQWIENYAGTPTWVFAVDGDECYDSNGLRELRKKLLQSQYQEFFKLNGNTLHCDDLNFEKNIAQGYITPFSKGVCKLYNFNAVSVWRNPPHERLHGGEVLFKEGYSDLSRFCFWDHFSWENSLFRCLHLCFLKRSSQDPTNTNPSRKNIDENPAIFKKAGWRDRIIQWLGWEQLPQGESKWKRENYAKGEKVEKEIASFFFVEERNDLSTISR